jgi:hypothetical protein
MQKNYGVNFYGFSENNAGIFLKSIKEPRMMGLANLNAHLNPAE